MSSQTSTQTAYVIRFVGFAPDADTEGYNANDYLRTLNVRGGEVTAADGTPLRFESRELAQVILGHEYRGIDQHGVDAVFEVEEE